MKKVFVLLAVYLALSAASPLPAKADGLDLVYTVSIDDPSSHLMQVDIDISNINPEAEELYLGRLGDSTTLPQIIDLSVTDTEMNALNYWILQGDLVYAYSVQLPDQTERISVSYSVDLTYDPSYHGASQWNLDEHFGAFNSEYVFLIIDPENWTTC